MKTISSLHKDIIKLVEVKQQLELITDISAIKEHYKNNISDFIDTFGVTYDPRNASKDDKPSIIPFKLFDKQKDFVNWVVNNLNNMENGNCVKSRDMGISWLCVAIAVSLCVLNDNIVIGFGSRKEEYVDKNDSPKSLFYKARFFAECLPKNLRGGFSNKTTTHLRINFPETNSYIVGEAGDNIGRGDRASLYFVDEAAFIERSQLIEASLSQTTECRIDISTPNGNDNAFAKKVRENKNVFRFHWRDDPRKSEEWYKKQVEQLDPVTVAQEIDINFNASVEGIVIPSEWVQSAIGLDKKLDLTGIKELALDVADTGKDSNAICIRNGSIIENTKEWSGKTVDDISESAAIAYSNCIENKIKQLIYDADGVGAGINGSIRLLNDSNKSNIKTEPFHGGSSPVNKDKEIHKNRTNGEFFANKKAQAWWELRNRFKASFDYVTKGITSDDIIAISNKCNNIDKLILELSQPTYSRNATGKLIIDKKPNNHTSPNLADAVMMAFAPKHKKSLSFFDANW